MEEDEYKYEVNEYMIGPNDAEWVIITMAFKETYVA